MVDDTALVLDGVATEIEGFETGTGAWEVLPAPDTSPGNASDFFRYDAEGPFYSATATPDTLLFGFGLEQLESDEAREEVVARILAHFAG